MEVWLASVVCRAKYNKVMDIMHIAASRLLKYLNSV